MYDCSRFNLRLEAASFGDQDDFRRVSWLYVLVAVPSITPPPITRQVSWWGFMDALSESEVVPDLRGAGSWGTTLAGDPEVSPCGSVPVSEILKQISLAAAKPSTILTF